MSAVRFVRLPTQSRAKANPIRDNRHRIAVASSFCATRFYASEKYPKEDEYSKFISEHGGFCNAYTAAEDTNYHFDVNCGDFADALDRFAQFFVAPLISEDGVSREMKAVDSENSKNLSSDVWRSMQLWKHLAKPDHVFHKFGTGNLDTLNVRPKAAGINTHERMLSFLTSHYSANLMKLAVYAKEPLDELEALVMSKFDAVKTTQKPAAVFEDGPFDEAHLCKLVRVVPIRSTHVLDFQWLIPPDKPVYRHTPCHYLSHLIGHEGPGSILKLLKDKRWANTLSAGEGPESYSAHALFLVSIELTDEGNEHVMEIAAIVFQYIRMLREQGLQRWVFDELKNVGETRFHFRDRQNPLSYVRNLTSSMHVYETKDLLMAMHNVPQEYSEAAIRAILDRLTPEGVRIMWSSKAHAGKTNAKEPWYGTEHSVESIDDGDVRAWRECALNEALRLPSPNQFIPTDFGLVDLPEGAEATCAVPRIIHESDMCKLWYKPDTRFKTPKGHVTVSVVSPECYSCPEHAVCTTLFIKMLIDSMNEVTYYAEVAGLGYSIQANTVGITAAFAGYSHKLFLLVREVIQRMATFKPKPERFVVLKEQLKKEYDNLKFDQPYQQALYANSVLMLQRKWHISEYNDVLTDLSFEDLGSFLQRFLRRVSLTFFCLGNLTEVQCVDLVGGIEGMLKTELKSKPIFKSQIPDKRVVKIAPGSNHRYATKVQNDAEENAAVDVAFQCHFDDFAKNVLVQLWVQIAERDAFHTLRTVEQIGYVVCVLPWDDLGVRSVHFLLQSTSHGCGEIDRKVEAWLGAHVNSLREYKQADFDAQVESLITSKQEKLKTLREESARAWKEIDGGALAFDRMEREIEALRAMTMEDLVRFAEETFGEAGRRKVAVHIMSAKEVPEDGADIEDMWAFKRSKGTF